MALRSPKTHKIRGFGGSPLLANLLFLAALQVSAEPSTPNDQAAEILAPGYQPLKYKAPEPGSYSLSDLGPAADASLLESNGAKVNLDALLQNKITVISFIYASCNEVNGCPLATSVLHRTQEALKTHPALRDSVRFVTISFDPVHDTPEVMARYAHPFVKDGDDWHFLTAASASAVTDLLSGYQQSITPERDAQGKMTGSISHVLRVILVDPKRRIRNIYTPSVLHSDLLLADILTLSLNTDQQPFSPSNPSILRASAKPGPGDDKSHYEHADYHTQSASLPHRQGTSHDLIRLSASDSLGLPPDPAESDSPLSHDKVTLGRKLFYDRRLSLNSTFSCAMCHIPEQGFTSQEQSTAIGIEGRTVRRNAPTILNVGRLHRLFQDGREDRLENQVWGPFLAANEMGNPAVGQVIAKIRQAPDYQGLFERAFNKGPTMDTIGEALAQYERTLIAGNSPFDQWYFGGQKSAISPEAQRGYRLFTGKARCSECHRIEKTQALLSDESFHNTGIGYQDTMGLEGGKTRVQLAPGVWTELDAATIAGVSEKKPADLGRYEVTQNPLDRWKYRTPGLRNVALTAPYMHNGALKSLEDVIRFYQSGGIQNPGLDPLIKPVALTASETKALIAFLESLTGSQVNTLIEDAWAAPIGDPIASPQATP